MQAAGDRAEGERLLQRFECKRCHADLPGPKVSLEKSCADCHRAIVTGKAVADADALNRWQQHVRHFVEAPRLTSLAKKLRNGWVQRFLLSPHDVRPGLEESMPRLALTPEQARDIASYLAPSDVARSPAVNANAGEATRGRRLLEERGCGTCHQLRAAPLPASPIPVAIDPTRLSRAIRLAPDLAEVRERWLPGYLETWLSKPSALDADALMPDIPLTPNEVRAIVGYLFSIRSGPALNKPFVRLPLLERRVSFDEVKQRVFRKSCRHCHSEPDYALGDGGPGNSGGFGFRGRGINLAEHEGVLAGYLDDNGARHSLFSPNPNDGRLVQSLLARHAEEAGAPSGPVRGMPLGLPALPAEDIQLVETWIAQGRAL
ncbi:MAG: c-type cytochrome [Myxococcota bacterium]